MYNIKITKTKRSKLPAVDFNNIPFGAVYTDHMFVMDYIDGQWVNPEIKPVEPLTVHPGNMAWHYGQSIFEGMKATKDAEGQALLFRPELHAVRMNASARRMCMPEIPDELFLEAIHTLIDLETDWIPPAEGSALYIRPFMVAMDHTIGVKPSNTYKFMILTLPVGPYYSKPVKLKADEVYIRAALGGTGEAKTAGNYAAAMYPAQKAKEEGYDQVMWLDAKEHLYVQEVGTMNIFFVIGDRVITPATGGTILKGITRKSVIEYLQNRGITVEERPIDIREIVEAYNSGELKEVFGSGTAAVISNVCKLVYKDNVMTWEDSDYQLSSEIKSFLNKLRIRKIEDPFGWVVPVKAMVKS